MIIGAVALLALLAACSGESPTGVAKTAAEVRAQRRAYDGAPPVIPHDPKGAACTACHGATGTEVPGVGVAPPSPHEHVDDPSAMSRCEQCHVYARTQGVFRSSTFEGLPQDLRRGRRQSPLAPPVIPHQTLLRENCAACHTGIAAREEIRCSHPERTRCRQCHVEALTTGEFRRQG